MSDDAGKLRLVDPSTGLEFDFGTVTNISETFQKSCSVTPIVTKPTQSAFPIESRTYKQIEVSFTRKSPPDADDSSRISTKWSNANWISMIFKSLNRWQARTDGYRLYYAPAADNPYIAPILGENGTSYETGYIRNLSYRAVKGRPESIQGSFEFHIGTMRVKTSASTGNGYKRDDFVISLSDANRANDVPLLKLTEDREVNLVDSCVITAGPETPFEYAQITIPRKALSALYPQFADSAAIHNRVKAGRNRLNISLAGVSTMTVTKVKLSNNTLTLTAYCDAERIKGYTTSGTASRSPGDWVDHILTSGYYGIAFKRADIIESYSSPVKEVRYKAKENLLLTFEKGTNVWFILQVAAMICGARVFFAKNKAYVVDYRSSTSVLSPTEIDLYGSSPGVGYAGAVVGNVDLGDEGMDTVANIIKIKCTSPKVKDGRYIVSEDNVREEKTIDYTVKATDGTIDIYKERDGGTFNILQLLQNENREELVYNGSLVENGTETPDTGESGSEGSEGGDTGESPKPEEVKDGIDEFYEQAERFGSNYLAYVSEAQQTVTFTLRELMGQGTGSWCPFFEPAAIASKIRDDANDIYVDNASETGSGAKYQKLALKTFSRNYPECTTEYTWGVLASMDLSSSTSRIVSAQSGN